MSDDKLEKLRTRWLRWLGQKTRKDESYWTILLSSNWKGWASKTLENQTQPRPSHLIWSRLEIKELFEKAINCADLQDLLKLDNLYVEEMIEKRK